MTIISIRFGSVLLAGLALLIGPVALAASYHGDQDHDHARHALDRGEIRPIAEILSRVASAVPGEVIEVEFEREERQGRPAWIYELKIIAPDGRLLEVQVDAATGDILDLEED